MTPRELVDLLTFTVKNNFNTLITGQPGIGKTDIVKQVCKALGCNLIISHPVVSDPTDYKGLPFAAKDASGKTVADFLPFGDLRALMEATTPTVFFLDDLGQAPASVQAAVMQLLLAREINGHKISDQVRFIAATNRKQDKAGVSGLLEPVKSRFATIVELEVNTDDWVQWALNNNMPIELIAFNRFRPDLLTSFVPNREIVNGVTPRTVAQLGRMQAAGIPAGLEFEAFKGAAGEAYATEYTAFLELFRKMPNIDQVIMNPSGTDVPTEPGILYGLIGALAHKMNDTNIDNIVTYLNRLPQEMAVCCMKDAITRKKELTTTPGFIKWSVKAGNDIMN